MIGDCTNREYQPIMTQQDMHTSHATEMTRILHWISNMKE